MKISTDAARSATIPPAKRRPRKRTTGDALQPALMVGGATACVVIPAVSRLAAARRGGCPGSPDPCVEEAVVTEDPGRRRLQAPHLLRQCVDVVGVGPDQVTAVVVLDLLHLVPVRLRLRLVELADRLAQQLVPGRALPVRLVVRRVRGERLLVEELERLHRPLALGEQ